MDFEVLNLAQLALGKMHVMWTLVLLIVRFGALMLILPGIGGGPNGIAVRTPAVIVLAVVSCAAGNFAVVPQDWTLLATQVCSEVLLGLTLGLVPLMMVAGVQLAGNLASTTMGLQPSQLIDPTAQAALPDISKIFGDVLVILFLTMGGQNVIVYAASGLGGQIIPGTYMLGQNSVSEVMEQTALMFRMGVTGSAPVVVALLLTNFVMGLVSKAIPALNIFIVSFPLTIGIGLALSVLMVPELLSISEHQIRGMESAVNELVRPIASEPQATH